MIDPAREEYLQRIIAKNARVEILELVRVHGQPFGFTQEHVEALDYKGVGYDEGHDQEQLDDIADLIKALLSPENPS